MQDPTEAIRDFPNLYFLFLNKFRAITLVFVLVFLGSLTAFFREIKDLRCHKQSLRT